MLGLPRSQQLKKNKKSFSDADLLDETQTIRFDKKEYRKRQDFVFNIGVCQVCENSYNMTTPHHGKYGAFKDDRYLVAVSDCDCHYKIHNVGYEDLAKSKEEIEAIGWDNHLEYLKIKGN